MLGSTGGSLDLAAEPQLRCSICGSEHPIEVIEPAFGRPDAYVTLTNEERASYAQADDDLCRIDDPTGGPSRWFVRAVLPVALTESDEATHWGLWTEVDEAVFQRILELWNKPDQISEPPLPAVLANHIPTYPETIGLPCALQLTGPTTRAEIVLPDDVEHPLVAEYQTGVTAHRAIEWVALVS